MICFILTQSHRYTLKDLLKDRKAPQIRLMNYDQLFSQRKLPWATYVFTDFDRLSSNDLELAGNLYLELKKRGLTVLNNPARVKLRYTLLRSLFLAGLNNFNVYKAEDLTDTIRFPVYVRKIRGHGRPCTDLLHSRKEVDQAIEAQAASGVPADHLVIIEYAGEPVRGKIYRKLAAYRMGRIIAPTTGGHDDQWLVKDGKLGIAGEELYQEEHKIVRDNPYQEELRKAFTLAEIEYGRADYGFYQGRLQIFEINTNPTIGTELPAHPFPIRMESYRLALKNTYEGLHSLDSGPGPQVKLPGDKRFKPYRKWTRIFYQSRPVP